MPRDGREKKNMFVEVYRIRPCCVAACICPQTHHSLAHTCAPRAAPAAPDCLQLLCREARLALRLQFSVVTSNPDSGLGHLPPGGALRFNAASARLIQLISPPLKAKLPSPKATGTWWRSQMSGLKSHTAFIR